MSRKRNKISPEIKERIYKRDNYKCRYCNSKKNLTIDHIIPIMRGGTNKIENLQVLCETCNQAKGHKAAYFPTHLAVKLSDIRKRIEQLTTNNLKSL